MKMKSCVALMAAGAGGAMLYQNIRNGNIKKLMKKMVKIDINAMRDLEDMM